MISLHITRKHPDKLYLMERDYPAQGISPYYTNICRVSEDEAATLLQSRLITAWMSTQIEGTAGDPGKYFRLMDRHGYPSVRLLLPASDLRAEFIEVEVPLVEPIRQALRNPEQRANFIANTGVRDLATA